MINCPKCNTDNLLNAIFCRGCGEKLELNELKPDSFLPPPPTTFQKIMKMINKVGSIVIGVLLVVIIVGLFCPVGGIVKPEGEPSAEATKNFAEAQKSGAPAPTTRRGSRRQQNAAADAPAADRTFAFSNEDATGLVNKAMSLPRNNPDDKMAPQHLSIDFQEEGYVRLVLTCNLMGKLPMHNVLIAKPTVENNTLAMNVESARIGILPMFGGLKANVIEKFTRLSSSCSPLQNIEKNLKRANLTAGRISITVGKK
ncbi:MAG TPA: zinc ribbon domain-containing protein [Lentisphaeria bacterium]|nr:zinc ribbon domain-containing protein [Lentisphaerota bacterium]OQC12580.1 MAG: hypothetical protein BWX73_02871 [Lentisphaerae bacterium ADurb.Bin082]HPY90584.1 zinc ribbon domain-containing protein [Lentisphaeria bacterium]HQC53828.1 zinc ribbon domain-containing protein [Lentisphaeria bacterium]HQL88314.1 zinc ribbon domain-containing protein [Lentisphaeria bacterium]